MSEDKTIGYFVVFVVLALVLIMLNPIVIVDGYERGVKKEFGEVQEKVYEPGLHFRMPIKDKFVMMNVRTQKTETVADAASKDLQETSTKVALNYHLIPESASYVYRDIGTNYEEQVIAPAIQEAVKAATAKFNAEELITLRPKVKVEIDQYLRTILEGRGIVVEQVYITNFAFSDEFSKAIEAKVTAEQKALEAQNDLKRIEIEADQKYTKAEGDARAIEVIQKQLAVSPEYIQYMTIEKWDGILPKVTGNAVPLIDVEV